MCVDHSNTSLTMDMSAIRRYSSGLGLGRSKGHIQRSNGRVNWFLRSVRRDFTEETLFVTSSGSSSIPSTGTGAINPYLEFSTTYERNESGSLVHPDYYYSRISNPTRAQFEQVFTKLEGGIQSFAFSSGMQAATAIMLSSPGSYVLLPDDLYHGVRRPFSSRHSSWSLSGFNDSQRHLLPLGDGIRED
jgi:cystathionine beta-lyase/cystathionine gamma-synthase